MGQKTSKRTFYIDGSCNNQKKGTLSRIGGVGLIEVREDKVICNSFGPYQDVSSDRMEVMGLLHCLRSISEPNLDVVIYCDNKYVVDGKMKKWYLRWVTEYRTHGTERPNIDLWDIIWEEIRKLATIQTKIELRWVKGHSGNEYNELADRYADKGRKEGRIKDVFKIF